MARRRFSPEKKLEIVLAAMRDEGKIPELLTKHQIGLDMLEGWREKFLEMGLQGLRYGKSTKEKALEKVIDRQKKIIADQAMSISILEEVKKHLQKRGLLKSPSRSSPLGSSR